MFEMFGISVNARFMTVLFLNIRIFYRFHVQPRYLLTSLALNDFAIGILITPLGILPALFHCWPYGEIFCQIQVSFFLFKQCYSIRLNRIVRCTAFVVLISQCSPVSILFTIPKRNGAWWNLIRMWNTIFTGSYLDWI